MNIKGVAKITAVYEDGREEVLLENEENDICWAAFRHIFVYSATLEIPRRRDAANEISASSARWRLFYGARDVKQSFLNGWYLQDGTVNVDTDYPVYTVGALITDPDKMTFRATIPAPVGSPRTINVIGLDVDSSGSGAAMTSMHNTHLTILKLSTPCTQATNVTLVVTYDLFLLPSQQPVDTRLSYETYNNLKALLKDACDVPGINRSYYGIRDFSFTPYDISSLSSFGLTSLDNSSANNSDGELTSEGMLKVGSATEVTTNSFRYSLTWTGNESSGVFIKHLYFIGGAWTENDSQKHNTALFYQSARNPTDTNPVQNVYGQRNSPPGPSQDLTVANTATMTGYPIFNVSNWVDPKYQKMVKLNITTGGSVGTAAYNISVMNFIAGFAGNRWVPRTAFLPQTMRPGSHFKKAANPTIYETLEEGQLAGVTYRGSSDGSKVLAVNCNRLNSGISIYDILTGQKYNFNTSNGLNITAASDGEVSGGFFYITCANTGLWRVSENLATVTQIPSPTGVDKAYQICKMNDANGSLWVLFDGGLCKLSNPADSVGSLSWTTHNPSTGSPTFTYAGITDANWANVAAMVVNPDNLAVSQFLFITGTLAGGDSSGNLRKGFVWWDTSTGVAANPGTNGYTPSGMNGANWTLANLLAISDQVRCCGNRWLASITSKFSTSTAVYSFQYGASSLIAVTLTMRTAERFIPCVINGVSGVLSTKAAAGASNYTGLFIPASQLTTINASVSITAASATVDFTLRAGANSYVANMETVTTIPTGNLSGCLLYLPASNMLFSNEYAPYCYGVTPFVLPPTHSKYATYKGAFWKDYGYDGANWVLGNAGSKTISGSNEQLAFLDNLGISFSDGASGTSFVANEWFIFAVGNGIFKDNGVTYSSNISFSLDPTKEIAISGNVPTTPLGTLTDEPLTFSLMTPNRSTNSQANDTVTTGLLQNKGTIFSRPNTTGFNSMLVADQLIPASSQFDLRFKWASVHGGGTNTNQRFGLITGTGTYTNSIQFVLNRSTGVLSVFNNASLLGTINTPDVNGECRIVRDASNNVTAYYNGVAVHAPVVITSQFSIAADATDFAYGQGWWDMKLSYTEARRVLRLGSPVGTTGSYSSKFSALTYSSLPNDVKVYIGSGTPLQAILDYTSSGVALTGTGRVKVCPGAGWLIFHDSEPANPISGSAIAHFVLNNQ